MNKDYQNNHSQIINYPINYDLFPKMKDLKFLEFTLNKNEFLLIPKGWYHWVISEPFTFALSFEIKNLKLNNSELCNNYLKQIPYLGKGKKNNFDYKNFINENKNKKFRILFSETNDCSPVHKNDTNKYWKEDFLENAYNETKTKDYFTYIGQNEIINDNVKLQTSISKYINIDEENINYKPVFWANLNKQIHSGLHNDGNSKILYVLEGTKKVLLLPNTISIPYFEMFPRVKEITNDIEDINTSNNFENELVNFYKNKNTIDKAYKILYCTIIITIITIIIIIIYFNTQTLVPSA
jgi:hypothetical protein